MRTATPLGQTRENRLDRRAPCTLHSPEDRALCTRNHRTAARWGRQTAPTRAQIRSYISTPEAGFRSFCPRMHIIGVHSAVCNGSRTAVGVAG